MPPPLYFTDSDNDPEKKAHCRIIHTSKSPAVSTIPETATEKDFSRSKGLPMS